MRLKWLQEAFTKKTMDPIVFSLDDECIKHFVLRISILESWNYMEATGGNGLNCPAPLLVSGASLQMMRRSHSDRENSPTPSFLMNLLSRIISSHLHH